MGDRRGFSLVELLMVLLVLAIAAGLAAPSLRGFVRRERVRGALNRVAADLHYTRMLAVRSGHGAVLRFTPDPRCAARFSGHGWTVAVHGPAGGVVKTVRADAADAHPLCLEMNSSDTVAFNSRGLLSPFANRTLHAVQGEVRDSLTVSVVGRIYRRF